MSDSKAKDLTETVFSFLSAKIKLIIIGVCIGLLLLIVILFGVIGMFSTNSNNNSEDSSGSSNPSSSSEVSTNTYKYVGAKFSMPFEVWDSTKDVITSKFSPSRTITVNGVTQTKAHTRNGFSLYIKSKS